MNLGHRMRIVQVEELQQENSELRQRLAQESADEIDLREAAAERHEVAVTS